MDKQIFDPPLISIVMPVYNRAQFLSEAFASIQAQSYENWELIIVDDGSTDNSLSTINKLSQNIGKQVVKIIQQQNKGPAGARNTGIAEASGDYLAFFDSDDLWLEHHLKNSIAFLQRHTHISWVYAACKRVNYFSNDTILQSTFYSNSSPPIPNKLFSIAEKKKSKEFILDSNKAVLLQLREGIDSGFQNSVIRAEVFNSLSIPEFRVGEDRLFIVMALKQEFRFGFIDDIHVIYRVHDRNISDTDAKNTNFDKRIQSMLRLLEAKKALPNLVRLNTEEYSIYKKQLSEEIVWELGYALYQNSGQYNLALKSYVSGIKLYPRQLKYYKTMIICWGKWIFSRCLY
ncbi:glycosyltransferase family 2 protein [Agaribacter flavus]|uniref:Glycosyltransferase family 2 protein n=1 Tax=Agaribacter flavus TaxID=1902781 RepID=A0ABV7FRE3_9ALTE